MAQLSLVQCDNCGHAQFTAGGIYAVNGATLKLLDGSEMWICPACLAHLVARSGMYELTGDAKNPVKLSENWGPGEQTPAG